MRLYSMKGKGGGETSRLLTKSRCQFPDVRPGHFVRSEQIIPDLGEDEREKHPQDVGQSGQHSSL